MSKQSKLFFFFFCIFFLISIIWGLDKILVQKDFTIFLTEEDIPIQSERFLFFLKN